MAKNLIYKRQDSLTLKAVGTVDIDSMTIEIDGEEKSIKTLMKGFDGLGITLNVSVKNDMELDEPTIDGSDE